MKERQPILTALLGRFDGELLPFGLFLRSTFGIKLHNRAIGNDRCDLSCTDLDGLLYNQFHVFAFWDCLPQDDSAPQWGCLRFMQFSQANFVVGKTRNFRSNFAASAIE